jgi:membrane protease YdiL (CAAX protease family)
MQVILLIHFGGYLVENNIEGPVLPVQVDSKSGKYPGPLAAGIFFSLSAILLTYGGVLLPFENKYLRSALGEMMFIFLPAMLFLLIGKYDLRATLKLKNTKPINYMLIIFLMISAMPVVGAFNAIVIGAIRLIFGKNLPIEQVAIPDIQTLLVAILVIGVSAAFCEEILFRGMISKGYERFGLAGSLIFTSVLFGILHRDIQKTVSTILLGILIGFIVYKTKSIFAGMLAHFTNNTAVVFITYGTSSLKQELERMGIGENQNIDFSGIPPLSLVFVGIFYLLIFVAFVSVFIALFYAFCRNNRTDLMEVPISSAYASVEAGEAIKGKPGKMAAFISVLPGLILILLVFVGQFLNLMNINSGNIYNFLRLMRLIK